MPLAAQTVAYPRTGVADAISATSLPAIGASVGSMWLWGDREDRHTARRAADGLIATEAVVFALKSLVDADRPKDRFADDGFPSAHTALAFCAATVLGQHDRGAEPWAYLWAASVGWSRTELGEHDWGQVLAGAAIGYLVGKQSARGSGTLGHLIVPRDSRPAACRLAGGGSGGVASIAVWSLSW